MASFAAYDSSMGPAETVESNEDLQAIAFRSGGMRAFPSGTPQLANSVKVCEVKPHIQTRDADRSPADLAEERSALGACILGGAAEAAKLLEVAKWTRKSGSG
jgi:hypothetical protein